MAFSIFWDDENVRFVVLIGATADSGGGSQGLLPNNLGYDEQSPPVAPNPDDDEFEGVELNPRWKPIGTLVEGGVARGISFTTPLGTARYSLQNRKSFLQLQPVSDPSAASGQGVYMELSEENKNGGSAPANWLCSAGGFLEVDVSTLPLSNIDSSVIFGLFNKLNDGSPDFANFVGCFIGTQFSNVDSPIMVGAVQATQPNDMEGFGTTVRLPALPVNSRVKIHKVGSTYRVSLVVDGRHVELGATSLPSLNPVLVVWYHINADTPNAISMIDYVRHLFTDIDAE